MSCALLLPLGASKCAVPYGDPRVMLIATEKIVYDDYADAQDIEEARAAVQDAMTAIVTSKFNDFEATAPEAVNEENGYSEQVFVKNTAGSAIAYLSTNPVDFTNYNKSFKGGTYYVEVLMANGYKLLTQDVDGTLRGFTAKINATPVGVPGLADKIKQYKLNLSWIDAKEFENAVPVEMLQTLQDYVELMPLGMTAEVSGAYAGSVQSYFVHETGNRASVATGLYEAKIIATNVLDPAVTPAAFDASGKTAVTITKGSTPVPLTLGDYVTFRLFFKVATSVEYVTQDITFKV